MTRQRALSVGFRTNRPAKAKVSFRNIQHPANIQTQSMANETRSHTKGIGYSAKDESGDIATDVYYATGSGTGIANPRSERPTFPRADTKPGFINRSVRTYWSSDPFAQSKEPVMTIHSRTGTESNRIQRSFNP